MLSIDAARDLKLRILPSWTAEAEKRMEAIEQGVMPLALLAEDKDGGRWLLHDEHAKSKHRRHMDNLRFSARKNGGLTGLRLCDPVVIKNLFDKLKQDELVDISIQSDAREQFLNIVGNGLAAGASDIHFVPTIDSMYIMHRVHGLMQKGYPITLESARRAIEAGANLSKDRVGASDENKIENLSIRNFDFDTPAGVIKATLRIGKTGSEHGPHQVIRLFPIKAPKTLEQLNLSEHTANSLRSCMAANQGIVMIVGPTGSGKSTTMNAALDTVDDSRMIQMVCDPVEVDFSHRKNVVTKSVDEKGDSGQSSSSSAATYVNLTKAALRQDPDILSIAEMRDAEVTHRVFEAALTAHLVLTTYHSIDPFRALVRLMKEGLNPVVMAESIECIASQRLVPKLCPACSTKHELNGVEFRLRNSVGCPECETGSVGRVTVDEALVLSNRMKSMIANVEPIHAIQELAIKGGYQTMKDRIKPFINEGLVCPLDAEMIVGDLYDVGTHSALLKLRDQNDQ